MLSGCFDQVFQLACDSNFILACCLLLGSVDFRLLVISYVLKCGNALVCRFLSSPRIPLQTFSCIATMDDTRVTISSKGAGKGKCTKITVQCVGPTGTDDASGAGSDGAGNVVDTDAQVSFDMHGVCTNMPQVQVRSLEAGLYEVGVQIQTTHGNNNYIVNFVSGHPSTVDDHWECSLDIKRRRVAP